MTKPSTGPFPFLLGASVALTALGGACGPGTSASPSVAAGAPVVAAQGDGVALDEPSPEADVGRAHEEEGDSIVARLSLGTARPVLAEKGGPACYEEVRRGYALLEQGELDPARSLIEGALDECPDYAPAHYDLAVIHGMRGEIDAGLAALERALKASYVRYAGFMQEDPELAPLRASAAWAGFHERSKKLGRDWAAALREPGFFLLLGHDDRRAVHVYDEEGRLVPDTVDPDTVGAFRGQLFFLHRSTGRLLPVSRTRRVGGFLADRERRKVHFFEWGRVKVLHGFMWETHPVGVERWEEEGALARVSVSTLDLDDLTVGPAARVPGEVRSRRLAMCGDDLVLGPEVYPPEPARRVTADGLEPFPSEPPDLDRCEASIEVTGPHVPAMLVLRECEDLPVGPGGGTERVCLLRDELYGRYRRVELDRPDEPEPLLVGPRVVQLERAVGEPRRIPEAAPPRG